jgi:hypothetical protein
MSSEADAFLTAVACGESPEPQDINDKLKRRKIAATLAIRNALRAESATRNKDPPCCACYADYSIRLS